MKSWFQIFAFVTSLYRYTPVLQSAMYTRASDVYSFAVVMWELRSLQVPWAALGQWQVMHTVGLCTSRIQWTRRFTYSRVTVHIA
jgi:serine/threonine protein kinase